MIYADDMEITRDAYTSGYAACGSTNAADNIGGYADFTVYLEGAYNSSTGLMSSNLELPLVSPYDGEIIDALPVVDGHNLIDWVSVELRSNATGSTEKSCNAFLLENGSLVDVNGQADLPFYYTTNTNYYIVINHRNHISIMTAESYQFADFIAESTVVDLAEDHLAVYGGGIKIMNDICAMYAGDMYKEEFDFIGSNDSNIYLVNYNLIGYNVADVNFDGFVGNADINYWLSNYSKAGTIPYGRSAINDLSSQNVVLNSENISIHYGISNANLVEYPNEDVYYEFDLIANSSQASRLLTGQILLGYNTDIFGTLITSNGNLVVNRMDLVNNMITIPGPAPDVNAYSVVYADFDKGILSAGSVWNSAAVEFMNYENANLINNVSQNYLHIAMKCSSIPVDDEIIVWFVENDLLASQQTFLDNQNEWMSYSGIAYDAVSFATPDHDLQTASRSQITGIYPNPFNPTTTLYYELAANENVNLKIYNVKGQLVKSVEEGTMTAGIHNITWNGDDNSGKNCSSGVYFFKLSTGSTTEMTRVLMLK